MTIDKNLQRSIEDLRLTNTLTNELTKNNRFLKGHFAKIIHQKGVDLNGDIQSLESLFGGNINPKQTANAPFSFDRTVRRDDVSKFDNNSTIGLIKNEFALRFKKPSTYLIVGSLTE